MQISKVHKWFDNKLMEFKRKDPRNQRDIGIS